MTRNKIKQNKIKLEINKIKYNLFLVITNGKDKRHVYM